MKKHNFGNVIEYSAWKGALCSHLEQILKIYPDYKPEEYILWLEPAMITPIQFRNLTAKILLLDKDGNELKEFILVKDLKSGKPYPNSKYHQLRMKSERGSVFGVPIRFKTFEELNRVKLIHIAWDMSFEIEDDIYISLEHMIYHVNFIPDEHKRMYTITEYAVCNIVNEWNVSNDQKYYQNWIKEFEHVKNAAYTKGTKAIVTEEAKRTITEYSLNHPYHVNASWLITVLSLNETLVPTDFSSIFDEPSYGFKQISPNEYSQYQEFIDYHKDYYNLE